jgi:fucokinase
VGQVEQLLTTGGGWQDQVGGIYPGIKLCQSNGTLESGLLVTPCCSSREFISRFSARTLLIYSGVQVSHPPLSSSHQLQRLAKNTLLNALRRHSHFPYDVIPQGTCASGTHHSRYGSIVMNLISTALGLSAALSTARGKEGGAVVDAMVDEVADHLNTYWEQKKDLAIGSETSQMTKLFAHLKSMCCGLSACGAGAGGFLVLILKSEETGPESKQKVEILCREFSMEEGNNTRLSVHQISVEVETGIRVRDCEE